MLGSACFCWFSSREQLLQWHVVEASFGLPLPAWSERDLLLQTLPECSFWKNLPAEGWFPSLVACALPRHMGQFFNCFYLVLRRLVRRSYLKELCRDQKAQGKQ